MNSMELASRLMGKLAVRNVNALVAEDAITLVDAINGGMREWYDSLPPSGKQTQVGAVIHSPVTATLAVTDTLRQAKLVGTPTPNRSGYNALHHFFGHTVTFNAAGPVNVLDGPYSGDYGALRKPFLNSASTGSAENATATIYGDGVPFFEDSIRIVGAPTWEGEGSQRWEMLPMQHGPFPYPDVFLNLRAPMVGIPRYYYTEPANPAHRAESMTNYIGDREPLWYLRIWPLPAMRGVVTFTLESAPPVIVLDNLQVPVRIPVLDRDVPDMLSLCEERLSGTVLWSPQADKQRVAMDAQRTRDRLRKMWIPLDARPAEIPTFSNW